MLIYFAVMLVALLGFAGLAIDVGRLELRQIQLQAAADAGALTGAAEVQHGNGSWGNAVVAEVTSMAAANGYPTPAISGQQGASAGPYSTDNSTIQVTLTETVPTTLLKLLGKAGGQVIARGVAMVPPCIFLMGPGYPSRGGNDLALNSTGLNSLSCPIYARHGFYYDGFSSICCSTPKTSGLPGASYGGGWTYPAIQSSSPAIPDPLAYAVSPSFSSCTYHNKTYTAATAPNNITPGTYCGGITVTNTTLNMAPGLYIITGNATFNGLNAGSMATVNGVGVELYLTQGGGSGFGQFSANYTNFTLSAPSDTSLTPNAAIVVFGDRSWSHGLTDFNLVFSSWYGDGIIYLTNTGIYDWTSNMSAPHYFTLNVANLSPQAAHIVPSANYSVLPGGDPLHLPIALVQ